MIDRQPYLPRFMAGGPGNPLGARAMYLGNTVYRIHGTNQPSTIGKFVSSGCIGMLNEDVSDLFDRVKVGTRVVVLPGGPPPASTTTASAAPVPGTVPARAGWLPRHAADRGAAAAGAGDGALGTIGTDITRYCISEKGAPMARLFCVRAALSARTAVPLLTRIATI